jgi:DNA-binding response OmpR family regulator
VIVLDRDLPGVHGDTLCRMITDDDDPAMILMLTAANAPTERVAGLALGADDYLSKPFHSPSSSSVSVALARRKPTSKRRALRAAGIGLTKSHARQAATDDNSISRPRNSACSKRSLRQARSLSTQKITRIR